MPAARAKADALHSSPAAAGEGVAAAVWLDAGQVELVRQVAERAGLRVTHAGCTDPSQRGAVAAALNAQPLADLRAALSATEAALFLIADAADFGAKAAHDDARVIRSASERGVRVMSLEPMPASLIELAAALESSERALDAGPRAEWARFAPISRWTSRVREAVELLDAFGPVRSASIQCLGAPAHGSLGARLLDAMDLVLAFLGTPDTIDACFVAASNGRAIHTAPGETLRGLHGDLAASLRFASGKAASVLASDQGGAWERVLTLLGPGGRLRVYADGFEWISVNGEKVDASRAKRTARGAAGVAPVVGAMAEQVEQFLTSGAGSAGFPEYAQALALAQTALLSGRTGEAESPATILRMAGV